MTASKRISPRSLGSDLAKVPTHVIQPEEYDELPELTDDMLARGKVNGESDVEADAAWGSEIERRVTEVESGAVKLSPAEDVHAEARRLIRR
jgi:hypothetical protein